MYDASSEILKYDQISSLLLVIGIFLAIVAVLMFFKFRIMQVFDRISGRGEQKERERINRINAKTTSETGYTGDVDEGDFGDSDNFDEKMNLASVEDLSEFRTMEDENFDSEPGEQDEENKPAGEQYVKTLKDRAIRTTVPAERNEKSEISSNKENVGFVGQSGMDDTSYLEDAETGLLDTETSLLDEETGILDTETSLLDEETGLLNDKTSVHEDETGLLTACAEKKQNETKKVTRGKFEIISEDIIFHDDEK